MTPIKYLARAIYWIILITTPALLSHALTGCSCPIIPAEAKIPLTAIGAVLAVIGIYLNVVAGRLLRRYGHTRRVRRFTAPDKLVDSGVFSCMRHPAQLGLILLGVGVALSTGTIISLIASAIPIAGGLLFIILVEEPEARKLLGEAYHKYEEKVPAFNLRLQCILRGEKPGSRRE